MIPTSRTPNPTDPYAAARAETARLTVPMKEVAAALNFSLSLCYELARRGTLPIPATQQPGTNRWLILRSDFNRYFGLPSAPTPTPLAVVPQVASGLLDALSHVKHQIAFLQFQQGQIEQQIAADHAADRQAVS